MILFRCPSVYAAGYMWRLVEIKIDKRGDKTEKSFVLSPVYNELLLKSWK